MLLSGAFSGQTLPSKANLQQLGKKQRALLLPAGSIFTAHTQYFHVSALGKAEESLRNM